MTQAFSNTAAITQVLTHPFRAVGSLLSRIKAAAHVARRVVQADFPVHEASTLILGNDTLSRVTGLFRPDITVAAEPIEEHLPKPQEVNISLAQLAPKTSNEVIPLELEDLHEIHEGVSAPKDLKPGVLIAGRYRVENWLNKGALGSIYLCHDEELDKDVVVKVAAPDIKGSNKNTIADEVNLMPLIGRQLPGAPIVDASASGSDFIVMEHIEGVNMAEFVRNRGGVLAERDVLVSLKVLAGVLSGLKQMHEIRNRDHPNGVINADLKPANIMIQGSAEEILGNRGRVVIVDPALGETYLTRKAGVVFGTTSYMAPEQTLGKDLSARSDLYAVGLVLYFMLTGRIPFQEVLNNIKDQRVDPKIDKNLEIMIRRSQGEAFGLPLTQVSNDPNPIDLACVPTTSNLRERIGDFLYRLVRLDGLTEFDNDDQAIYALEGLIRDFENIMAARK